MKELQKKRMKCYFIEAASRIIEQEGLENLTVRKVANLAGYNSATLYNYFENFDHLIFFASMRHLKDYSQALPDYIADSKDSLDRYYRIWELFCLNAYSKPEIFNAIFFGKFNIPLEESVTEYYSLFPQDLGSPPEDLLPMLLKQDLFNRSITTFKAIVKEGFIREEDVFEINEATLLIYQGMLSRIINKQVDYTPEEAMRRTIKYMKIIMDSYLIK
jgi:AcrR family transcriptional regulator